MTIWSLSILLTRKVETKACMRHICEEPPECMFFLTISKMLLRPGALAFDLYPLGAQICLFLNYASYCFFTPGVSAFVFKSLSGHFLLCESSSLPGYDYAHAVLSSCCCRVHAVSFLLLLALCASLPVAADAVFVCMPDVEFVDQFFTPHLRRTEQLVAMVKQKNHTNRNQSFKAHRNGIKKTKRQRFSSLRGVSWIDVLACWS